MTGIKEWIAGRRQPYPSDRKIMVEAINSARDDGTRKNCIANFRAANLAREAADELLKRMEKRHDIPK